MSLTYTNAKLQVALQQYQHCRTWMRSFNQNPEAWKHAQHFQSAWMNETKRMKKRLLDVVREAEEKIGICASKNQYWAGRDHLSRMGEPQGTDTRPALS